VDTVSLVSSARRGNDDAFYQLIEQRKHLLYRTAYAYVKNREDAMDIVGDTVYKAYKSLRKLKEPAFFNTWLTRILINCCLDHLKKTETRITGSGDCRRRGAGCGLCRENRPASGCR